LDLDKIMRELEEERDRVSQAIALLKGTNSSTAARRGMPVTGTALKPRRGGMSAAGRKRLSELMKKRWAERRRKKT
jgi:hypothetical protein